MKIKFLVDTNYIPKSNKVFIKEAYNIVPKKRRYCYCTNYSLKNALQEKNSFRLLTRKFIKKLKELDSENYLNLNIDNINKNFTIRIIDEFVIEINIFSINFIYNIKIDIQRHKEDSIIVTTDLPYFISKLITILFIRNMSTRFFVNFIYKLKKEFIIMKTLKEDLLNA